MQLCKELAESASNEDEKKVAMIWNARMSKFRDWDEGKGDYEPILPELAELSALPQDSVEAWSAALGRYFVKCMRSGIKTPPSTQVHVSLRPPPRALHAVAASGATQ